MRHNKDPMYQEMMPQPSRAWITSMLILLVFISAAGGGLGYKAYVDYKALKILEKNIPAMSDPSLEGTEHCRGLSLNETAICVRNWMSGFFNYTRTPDNITASRSMEDIIREGGDCWDYSLLYNYTFTNLGFKSQIIFIEGEELAHAFVIVSDDVPDYCKLDMLAKPICS